jgi:hypothetical protein
MNLPRFRDPFKDLRPAPPPAALGAIDAKAQRKSSLLVNAGAERWRAPCRNSRRPRWSPTRLRSAKPSSLQRKKREVPREDVSRLSNSRRFVARRSARRWCCLRSLQTMRPFGQRDLDVRRSTRSTRGADGVTSTPVFGGNAQIPDIPQWFGERVKWTRSAHSLSVGVRTQSAKEPPFRSRSPERPSG